MTTLPPTARQERLFPKLLLGGAILIGIILFIKLNTPVTPQVSADPAYQRKYFVPPFALAERSGRTITNQDLSGKIWVADFVYTTCPGPCPIVSASMADLQKSLASDPKVQLITFTVDPVTDTPAVLSDYADKLGASKDRWWFLTGTERQMSQVVHDGFLMAMTENAQPLEPGQYKITHSTQLALVDGDGVIQGYFDGTTADGRTAVLNAIAKLEKQ